MRELTLCVRHHNTLEGRSGTLWEGRYKSSPVDSDAYLLACDRYIELNPVRARICTQPERYPWSSYRHRLAGDNGWLDRDPCYLALGRNRVERTDRYRAFLRAAIPDGEWSLIREALQRGQLTGGARYADEVEAIIGRRIERRGQGRPRTEK
jgi:REP-associated tyrosine transposase